jgi:hypothetical protein
MLRSHALGGTLYRSEALEASVFESEGFSVRFGMMIRVERSFSSA